MFTIERASLWLDIERIFKDGDKPVRHHLVGLIHTEVGNVQITQIKIRDVVRDYANKIGDEIFLEFVLPMGVYVRQFIPYVADMELTINYRAMELNATSKEEYVNIEIERYKVIFLPEENKRVKGLESDMLSKENLDLQGVVDVKVQLINRALEPLRIKTTGGIFQKVNQESLLRALVGYESKQVLIDGKPAVEAISIVDPDNTEVQDHVIIPQGTRIISIPTYLQEKMNGVYNAGIGNYFQTYRNKKTWFIYSLYDTERFTAGGPRAVFYNVPRERFMSVEHTYRVVGDVLHVLATSGKEYKDSADTDFMERGVGFRMTDARPIMRKPVIMTSEGPIGKRTKINFETIATDRDDGLNYAPRSSRRISSNPFVELSKVLARKGGKITLQWENCDIRHIYPGMPCTYIFLEGGRLRKLKGVIQFVHGITSLETPGINSRAYRSNAMIQIYCEQLQSSKSYY